MGDELEEPPTVSYPLFYHGQVSGEGYVFDYVRRWDFQDDPGKLTQLKLIEIKSEGIIHFDTLNEATLYVHMMNISIDLPLVESPF